MIIWRRLGVLHSWRPTNSQFERNRIIRAEIKFLPPIPERHHKPQPTWICSSLAINPLKIKRRKREIRENFGNFFSVFRDHVAESKTYCHVHAVKCHNSSTDTSSHSMFEFDKFFIFGSDFNSSLSLPSYDARPILFLISHQDDI
jgi:hypothetical protein